MWFSYRGGVEQWCGVKGGLPRMLTLLSREAHVVALSLPTTARASFGDIHCVDWLGLTPEDYYHNYWGDQMGLDDQLFA